MADPQAAGHDSDLEENEQNVDNQVPRARRPRGGNRAAEPLENLLRLLAGPRMVERAGRDAAGNNDELVTGLKRSGMLSR